MPPKDNQNKLFLIIIGVFIVAALLFVGYLLFSVFTQKPPEPITPDTLPQF